MSNNSNCEIGNNINFSNTNLSPLKHRMISARRTDFEENRKIYVPLLVVYVVYVLGLRFSLCK